MKNKPNYEMKGNLEKHVMFFSALSQQLKIQ